MAKNKLGELVLKAKGDRSYREYQRDSGVDAATISKIATGSYIPTKTEVFRKLTSPEAKPQNGVTFEDLAKAANDSANYKAGMEAGMEAGIAGATTAVGVLSGLGVGSAVGLALGGPLGLVGSLAAAVMLGAYHTSKDKVEISAGEPELPDELKKMYQRMKRFQVLANGIIFGQLTKKGLAVQQDWEDDKCYFDNELDIYLQIKFGKYSKYFLRYVYVPEEMPEEERNRLIEAVVRRLVGDLIFFEHTPERKVSVVVNSEDAFDELLSRKNRLSYSGNLSVICINPETVELEAEDFISVADGMKEEELQIL